MKHARKSPWRLLYKFHRYSGLTVAVIAIILAITGIVLNHTEDLQLDNRFVKSAILLDWYGIDAKTGVTAFNIGNHWISQRAGHLYFDEQALFKSEAPLLGAIAKDEFIVIAHAHALTLLTFEGEIVEKIEQPRPVQAIGINEADAIVVKRGNNNYRSDDGLLSWQVDMSESITWAMPSQLPKDLDSQLQQHARQQILPYERVVLDLHSGRLFGKTGVFIVDLSGVILILLAISGSWIWLRHKLKSLFRRKNNT
jgi:hypothetical protein